MLWMLPLSCWCALALPGEKLGTLPALEPELTQRELEHHVRSLASDEWRGRFTGTPEAVAAGRYLAAVLEKSGLEPAGDAGSYLQKVPIQRPVLVGQPLAKLHKGGDERALLLGSEWKHAKVSIPKARYRVVIARSAAEIPAEGLENAALFVDTQDRKQVREWLQAAGKANANGIGVLLTCDPRHFPMRKPAIALDAAAQALLRSGAWTELELDVRYEQRDLEAYNVVARIPATNKSGRAVVLSAHYDHLAEHEHAEPGTDTIFNGADDDASGCAVVLELAGRFAKERPKQHDLIVLLATGEEIGLVGTHHYLKQPVVPLDRTLININFEMLGRADPLVGGPGNLWLTGWEETSLGPQLAALGVQLKPDPRPDQNFYRRSDNYAFVERGVMGQTISSYNMHADYHTVRDEVELIDFAHLYDSTQISYRALRVLFDGEIQPSWAAHADPKNKTKPKQDR
jgi:Peptidase family M28